VNTGVYRFPAEFHARVRAAAGRGVAGITDVLDEAIREGVRIEGVRSSDLWSDAVYPWDLLRVNADLLRASPPIIETPPGVTIRGPVLIGEGATLDPGCVLGPGTVIGDDVQVGPHCILESCVLYQDVQVAPFAYVRNAILGEGTRVGPRFTSLSGPSSIRQRDGWHDLDDFGAVVGEDCRIGGGVTLLPGALVGNRVQIAHGKTIAGALEDGAMVR